MAMIAKPHSKNVKLLSAENSLLMHKPIMIGDIRVIHMLARIIEIATMFDSINLFFRFSCRRSISNSQDILRYMQDSSSIVKTYCRVIPQICATFPPLEACAPSVDSAGHAGEGDHGISSLGPFVFR
ncbi:hypothetical protein CLJ08_02755 [Pseudomonas mosselii]|nr:hypothetical protein CLJ08_02755 [Pseudomonas mosselii]